MRKLLMVITTLLSFVSSLSAQDVYPSINPTATFTNPSGEEEESSSYSGSAPIVGKFYANPENVGSWNEYYEWRFTKEGDESLEPYLIRYEENTEYTFVESGSHRIVLYAIFTQGNDTVAYTDDYWLDAEPIRVTVSESKLTMPNAFSPNDDGINEVYKAKEYQSLVEFRAIIFNRWGQKIYEWTDPSQGWDGKHNGKDVKEGVYFVDVQAKGADGRKYHIRRDVNLLRGYNESTSSSSSSGTGTE